MKLISKNRGVALLEVLVAFVIVSFSVVALVGLHRYYLQTEAESSLRAGAMHLAESKLDDLRTFDSVASATGVVAYNDIAANTGGTIAAGTVTMGSYSYTLGWTVTNNYLTTPAHTIPDSKNLAVTVSWKDFSGVTQSIVLSGTVSHIVQVDTAQLTTISTASSVKPQVSYTPGSAPDVVSMDLGNGSKQETTKPLPTVANSGGSIQVQFNSLIYNSSLKTQVQSDFQTLSCNCTNNGLTANSYLPASPIQLSSGLYWSLGNMANKSTAVVANNQQPTLCNICCQNHYDAATSPSAFPYYYNQLNQNAAKYSYNGSSYTVITNGSYIDACRLLRVDGYYKPMPDWNLVKLSVMDSSFLTDSQNVAKYQAYIKYVVGAYINLQKSMNWAGSTSNKTALDVSSIQNFSTWLSANYSGLTTNVTVSLGATPEQLIARGIFVDIMDKSTTWLSSIDTTKSDFLSQVPFYDINMTLLSRWTSASSAIATVSNETIKTLTSTDPDYYGVYRRGYVTPVAAGSSLITASAYQGNSAISAYQYNKNALEAAVSVFENGNGNSGSLTFAVSSGSGTGTISIIGKIYCYDQQTKVTGKTTTISLVDCTQGKTNNLNNIGITGSGATCVLESVKNVSTYLLYNCTVPSLPATGASVSVTAKPTGFSVAPASVSFSSLTGSSPLTGGCFNVYNSSIDTTTLPLPTTCP